MSQSRFAALGLACLVSGACTGGVQQAPEQPEPAPAPRSTGPPPRAMPVRRAPNLGIPPGHLPGPGYCRVWVEGTPSGRQARTRACEGILPYAPEGSWILYRPASRQQEIRVRHVHNTKHGLMVVAVRVYEAQTGRHLRDLTLGEDDDNMGPASNTRSGQQAGGQVNRRAGDAQRGREADHRPSRRGGDNETPLGADARASLGIDARSFPPAGQCRVWLPGRSDRRQARAASCGGIANDAPAGAMILRRSPNQPNVILVDYIDEAQAGQIVRTSVYDANSGAFIREEK